jgi:hypothetical protein
MTTPIDGTQTDDTDVSDDDIISAIVDRASNDDDFLDSLLSALDNAGLLDEDTGEEGQEDTGDTGNGAGNGNGSQSAAEAALRNLLAGKAL